MYFHCAAGGIGRRSLLTNEIIVDFEVELASASEAEAYYTALSDSLVTAVADGTFTATITAIATEAGVTSLESAVAEEIFVGDYEVVYEEVDDDNDDSPLDVLNYGAIVGIAIGAVVFVILIVGVIFYMMGKRAGGADANKNWDNDARLSPVVPDDKSKVELLQLK